ncbi:MAG: hypothetical protein EOO61_10820, partial [Hymenobacter sp.]
TDRPHYFKKMQSCGRVVIEDFVEIGANCTIDRGVTADTLIGAGTKIDNLVHIGHDVTVGKNCLIAAQVGIAGATVLEDEVILWGQVGVNKTITLGKGVEVLGQSGVTKSLPAGNGKYFGTPADFAMNKNLLETLPNSFFEIKSLQDIHLENNKLSQQTKNKLKSTFKSIPLYL